MSAKKRRPKTALASPGEFLLLVHALKRDALAVVPMYQRLHSLGLEPPRGDSVHVAGGGISNVPSQVAVDSDYAASRRDYARWVVGEMLECAKRIDKLHQGLERHVGPTPGFRQPAEPAADNIGLSLDELSESIDKQAVRLKQGVE